MRDNLDLKQLAKEANRLRLWARFTTLIAFLVLILSVFMTIISSSSIQIYILGFLCLTVVLIAFFVAIIVNSSRNATRLRAARSLLEPLVLPVSNSLEVNNTNWLLIAIVIVIIIMVALSFLGQPELVDISGLIMFALFCVWIARRTLQYSGTNQKSLSKFRPIVLFIGWMAILWFGTRWIETTNPSLVSPFFIVWVVIGFIPCAFSIVRYFQRYTGENAYANATDDNTKINVSGARKVSLQLIQASTALQAGHVKEAETFARTSVEQSQYLSSAVLSAGLNVLGLALMYQEHYEEAIQFIEIAIRINPISLSTLTSLAEVYLEAGDENERAFEVIEFARYYGFENWLVRLMRKSSRPITEGVYAWSLARLGRVKEADKYIQKAMKTVSPQNKSKVAYLYFIHGKIETIKGNPTKAVEWLTRASQSDSGLYGQMAADALKELAARL